jgi:hypothetical protein
MSQYRHTCTPAAISLCDSTIEGYESVTFGKAASKWKIAASVRGTIATFLSKKGRHNETSVVPPFRRLF